MTRPADDDVNDDVDDDVEELTSTNRIHWDDVFDVYPPERWDSVRHVLDGGSSIPERELLGLGDVRGLTGIHLQAGIGLDTITLARLGARMTGVDISPRACEIATGLARRCGVSIPFVQADVMDLDRLPRTTFDFVYTSHGVLRWLPSLDRWAAAISGLLDPGGWVYVFEIHPIVYHITAAEGGRFTLTGDYFDESVRWKVVDTTHLGPAHPLRHRTVVHANWTLATVVQSLLRAGLQIVSFAEYAGTSYSRKGLLPVHRDGLWWSENPTPVPLSFAIRAIRTTP